MAHLSQIVRRQIMVFRQDAVFERLVPVFDLSSSLRIAAGGLGSVDKGD